MAIVDIHTHWGKWGYPNPEHSAAEMVATLRARGIGRAVASAGPAIVYDFREGNRAMADAIAPYPEILGYVVVNANYVEDSLAELKRYADNRKFVGAKMHPLYSRQKVSSPNSQRVVRAISELGWPLLVHTFSSAVESPWNLLPVAKANPGMKIIMGHMGGDTWCEGIQVAKECPNLYLEPCTTWADADKIRIAVDEIGAERLLFGSDYSLFDPAHSLGMIEDADLSAEERELILHVNAERLFGERVRV